MKFGERAVVVAHVAQRLAAQRQAEGDAGTAGIEFDGAILILQRPFQIAGEPPGVAAIGVVFGIFRSELDRNAEIGRRLLVFAHRLPDQRAVVVGRCPVGIIVDQRDRPVDVGEGRGVIALVAIHIGALIIDGGIARQDCGGLVQHRDAAVEIASAVLPVIRDPQMHVVIGRALFRRRDVLGPVQILDRGVAFVLVEKALRAIGQRQRELRWRPAGIDRKGAGRDPVIQFAGTFNGPTLQPSRRSRASAGSAADSIHTASPNAIHTALAAVLPFVTRAPPESREQQKHARTGLSPNPQRELAVTVRRR